MDRALVKFIAKTEMHPSKVIRDAIEEFVITKAKGIIPKLAARVEINKTLAEYKSAGNVMKMLLSAGHSSVNLDQVERQIEGMALTDPKKDEIRDAAMFYNSFKTDGKDTLLKLFPVAYPSYKSREETFPEKTWRTKCVGCSYVGNLDFCIESCKGKQGTYLRFWSENKGKKKR